MDGPTDGAETGEVVVKAVDKGSSFNRKVVKILKGAKKGGTTEGVVPPIISEPVSPEAKKKIVAGIEARLGKPIPSLPGVNDEDRSKG